MANKLNEGEQFQQKFLSNISHDFRSPLTSIKGYLEAMADGTIPPEMMDKYFNILLLKPLKGFVRKRKFNFNLPFLVKRNM